VIGGGAGGIGGGGGAGGEGGGAGGAAAEQLPFAHKHRGVGQSSFVMNDLHGGPGGGGGGGGGGRGGGGAGGVGAQVPKTAVAVASGRGCIS